MMDDIDDAYTESELKLNMKVHSCAIFLKKMGYFVLSKSEYQKNTQFKMIIITMICTLMFVVGLIVGRIL